MATNDPQQSQATEPQAIETGEGRVPFATLHAFFQSALFASVRDALIEQAIGGAAGRGWAREDLDAECTLDIATGMEGERGIVTVTLTARDSGRVANRLRRDLEDLYLANRHDFAEEERRRHEVENELVPMEYIVDTDSLNEAARNMEVMSRELQAMQPNADEFRQSLQSISDMGNRRRLLGPGRNEQLRTQTNEREVLPALVEQERNRPKVRHENKRKLKLDRKSD